MDRGVHDGTLNRKKGWMGENQMNDCCIAVGSVWIEKFGAAKRGSEMDGA
jgi:hypothetical protein